MNKIVKGLLLGAISTGVASAYTNHTTLSLRSHGYNLARDFTTFNEMTGRRDDDTRGRSLQLTGFYQASSGEKELGKYFGISNHYSMLFGHAASGAVLSGADLDSAYLIHEGAGDASQATVTLKPTSESYGVVLTSFSNLEKLMKGLYMSTSIPLVHIKNDMHMTVSNATGNATATNVFNYFNGTFTGIDSSSNAQLPLAYAKIDGMRSKTGIADIETKIGYNFLDEEDYRLGGNIGWTTPTGNCNKGTYVFQPIVGNGEHSALGLGFDGFVRVWGDERHNIKLAMVADYRFLFDNTEYRTFGLKKNDGTLRNWGHYHLLARPQVGGANGAILSPAANHTTLNCEVTPGSQVEGLANIAYNNGGLSIDMGYNLFWREKEEVKIKGTYDTFSELFGVANRALSVADGSEAASTYGNTAGTVDAGIFGTLERQFDENAASTNTANTAANMKWLTTANLDIDGAQTPSVLTHKIYAGVGYLFREWYLPVMMGLGGSYELTSKNSTPDFWSVYGKLSIGF
ncbi:MAG: hypothetical protein WCT20_00920 [Candidatus Babeliales bacterium]